MQIANRLAGFSLGDADLLRRAMGKKKPEEMAAQREKFLTGCHARKVPAKKAEKIFDLMAEFAGYGFNKSHSCAYALLAYQTAWLKTHYPVEFMAAMLTSETGNTEKVVKYINEARSMGITVLPPDVNSSDMNFTPVGDSIRFGFAAIKNVGENTVKGILAARETLGGRFTSFYEFCESVDARLMNKRVLESLVRAGALDGLGAHRAQMIAVIDRDDGARAENAARQGKRPARIFSAEAALRPLRRRRKCCRRCEEWPEHELLAAEHSTLGFYISGHPLDKYAGRLQDLKAVETFGDRRAAERRGYRSCRNHRAAAADALAARRAWAILTLQDRTGVMRGAGFSRSVSKARRDSKVRDAAAGERANGGRGCGDARDRVGRAIAGSGARPGVQAGVGANQRRGTERAARARESQRDRHGKNRAA